MHVRVLLLSAGLLITQLSFAQSSEEYPYVRKPDSTIAVTKIHPQRLHVGAEVGTSVSTSFRGGAAWSTFVSPYLSYRVSPRWTFNAGATVVNTQGNLFYPVYGDGRSAVVAPQTSTFLFAQGQYQASERLRVTGTSFYELSRFNQSLSPQARGFSYANQGMSIYAEYKISEHFSFGVGAQYSNGNAPYYNRALGASRFGRSGPGSYWGW